MWKVIVVQIKEEMIKHHLNDMVRSTVEDALNQMLDVETQQLCNNEKYECSKKQQDSGAGYIVEVFIPLQACNPKSA